MQVLPRAQRQMIESALWWAEHRSALVASRWLSALEFAIRSLADDPDRFPLAAESDTFDFPLRQLSYGLSRRSTHRVLFAVRSDLVLVYALRHLAQAELMPDDLE